MKKKKVASGKTMPKKSKNFFDYPLKEQKRIIKKAAEESNKKQRKLVKKSKPKKLTTEELEAALFEVGEDLDKAVLKVMLLGETLRSIKEDNEIKGSKIELGLKKERMTKEVKGWFKEFGYDINDKFMTKEFKGVPIEIKIIKRNYPFFKHPDMVFYKSFEVFDIPNPWRAYMKVRGFVR